MQNQESGIFLRHYKSPWKLKEFNWIEDCYSEKKNITITGIPRQIGQVKYTGQLLSELVKLESSKLPTPNLQLPTLNHTAVVLADENLFLPL